jgi:flagellar basal-body rod protein FlgF
MNAAMYKALSGALVQTRRLEMVTQDLANVNTAGYKGLRLVFREVLEGPQPPNVRIGGQVTLSEQHTNLANGTLHNTGNPLDLALAGDGLFAIQTPNGVRYTRQGAFSLSASHTIVTPTGEQLLGERGPIRVEGAQLLVEPDGSVIVDGADIDRLRIVRPHNGMRLSREGANYFRAKDDELESAVDTTQVLRNTIEDANVNSVEAMVALIDVERQFEAYEHAMRLMDGTTEKVVNEAGKA